MWVKNDNPKKKDWYVIVVNGEKLPALYNDHNKFWCSMDGKTYKPEQVDRWLDHDFMEPSESDSKGIITLQKAKDSLLKKVNTPEGEMILYGVNCLPNSPTIGLIFYRGNNRIMYFSTDCTID